MRIRYKEHLNLFAKKLRKARNFSEVLLWNELKQDKLGCRFLRQRPVGRYVVDFLCHSLELVIEIDGAATHDYKIKEDKERQEALESLGLKVIRFTDADVRFNLEGVIEAIKQEILRRFAPPPLKKEEYIRRAFYKRN